MPSSLYVVCSIISALKHLMKRVLERLMDTVVDDDEEEEEAEQASAQLNKSVHCSLSTLCAWYNAKTKVRPLHTTSVHSLGFVIGSIKIVWSPESTFLFQKSNTVSPGKKRSSAVRDDPQPPPLVIIFKDLEAFNPRVLQDFILICR